MGEAATEDGVRLSYTIFRADTEALLPCRRSTRFGGLRMAVAKADLAISSLDAKAGPDSIRDGLMQWNIELGPS